ncbi:shufflon system plasmid conjugative transfer pilus tip adhesin PilV, partial [Escherichia coli]|nr:shufflon system plasmid conjugative transfer pilus tip adhesin PilV [Escherichia coli]EJO9114818.1 shufflon system plasmid conjugative transfer pilus tip adhesin PilV [Escherichia coli]
YLRRDGTLPMTGNLNMGGQSVYNAQDITATGNTVSGTLRSTGATTVGSTLNVAGSTTLSNTTINGTLNVNNTIASSATITGANITSQAETYTQNWFRTMGDGGIYFQKYGGGWNMTDTNTITAYGGKNIQTTAGFYGGYIKSSGNLDVNGTANIGSIVSNNIHSNANITAAGQIISGSLVSNGRTTVGEFIQLNGTATVGAGCSPNGLIGKDSTGAILSCSSGVWKSAGKVTPTIATFSITETKTTQNISGYDYCSIGIIQQDNGGPACYVENKGNKQWKLYGKADYDNSCTATCMVFN